MLACAPVHPCTSRAVGGRPVGADRTSYIGAGRAGRVCVQQLYGRAQARRLSAATEKRGGQTTASARVVDGQDAESTPLHVSRLPRRVFCSCAEDFRILLNLIFHLHTFDGAGAHELHTATMCARWRVVALSVGWACTVEGQERRAQAMAMDRYRRAGARPAAGCAQAPTMILHTSSRRLHRDEGTTGLRQLVDGMDTVCGDASVSALCAKNGGSPLSRARRTPPSSALAQRRIGSAAAGSRTGGTSSTIRIRTATGVAKPMLFDGIEEVVHVGVAGQPCIGYGAASGGTATTDDSAALGGTATTDDSAASGGTATTDNRAVSGGTATGAFGPKSA
ncbi:hypothetical protein B0H14DRAFT_2567579 [Mycena olivaceomarginata]|nr:hypothetical protein B0H14DRAFT_2567579 [Mycena olivaceomarginata]